MIISAPVFVSQTNGNCEINFAIKDSHCETKSLIYTINADYKKLVSDSLDAAVIALLVPCMALNEVMILQGKVSKRLYTNLQSIQLLLNSIYPELSIINISCDNLVTEHVSPLKRTVVTGFSAGVDSFATVADLGVNNIDLFLFNNVGSHGLAGETLFDKRYEIVKKCTHQLATPLMKVNANLDLFYNDGDLNFIYNHTLRNASVALLVQKGVNEFYYASAYHIRDFMFVNRPAIAHLDPMLLPMLSTESLLLQTHGTTLSRLEKTRLIIQETESHQYLDVCVDEEKAINCSNCFKCRRTMATLDIMGYLDLYKNVFDISTYYKNRFHIFYEFYVDKSPLSKEVIALAEEQKYALPAFSKFLSRLKLPYRVKKRLKGITV